MSSIDSRVENAFDSESSLPSSSQGREALRPLLAGMGSLKITVALFGISMILVFAGTTAQRYYDVWEVVDNYFRTWVAWIDVRDFLPETPLRKEQGPGFKLPFPGGYLIGFVMSLNLLSAHAFRFKISARGNRRLLGLAVLAAGALATFLVIRSGLDDTIESELSPEFLHNLWAGFKSALGGGCLLAVYWLAVTFKEARGSANQWAWWLGTIVTALALATTIWMFVEWKEPPDASGMRILWQITKAMAASLVLLAGCVILFGKRAGVVLLHGGIALMMLSELNTALTAVETHARLYRGQPETLAEDLREVELAVVTPEKDRNAQQEVLVPMSMLVEFSTIENTAAEKKGSTTGIISDERLPVDLRVVEFYQNAVRRLLQPGEESPATAGLGEAYTINAKSQSTGVDQDQTFDAPGGYLEVLAKPSGKSLGTYLFYPDQDAVEVRLPDGNAVEISLRFKPYDKPYQLTLLEFTHETYVGTSKAKNFRSLVRLQDEEMGIDRQIAISMNNPLRYRGDTIYQSGFDPQNENYTDLQVVTNMGWMIPYVSCMIVATGMIAHFGVTLLRFLRRRDEHLRRNARHIGKPPEQAPITSWKSAKMWVPALIVLVFGGAILGRLRTKRIPPTKMQIQAFAELPIAYGGRIQPIDTYARNTLRSINHSEDLTLDESVDSTMGRLFGSKKKLSATHWLLDTITDTNDFKDYRCLRIESLDVLGLLKLDARPGFRYSINDVLGKSEKQKDLFEQAAAQSRTRTLEARKDGRPQEATDRQLLDLSANVSAILAMIDAFNTPNVTQRVLRLAQQRFPDANTPAQRLMSVFQTLNLNEKIAYLNSRGAPQVVPPRVPSQGWELMMAAGRREIVVELLGKKQGESDQAASKFQDILTAYKADDAPAFNTALLEYQKLIEDRAKTETEYEDKLAAADKLGRKPAERLDTARLKFEAWFNEASLFTRSNFLYVTGFVLACFGLMGWSEGFNRSANWLLWVAFALHTVALICRIYISGRPPVTNLYSSAVFIGWAGVLFSLLFEAIYGRGIGNLLAGILAFPTLIIAYYLSADGDTFTVMQAVLDTQFWLATHVVCITLGYATTYLTGVLGIAYLVLGHATNHVDEQGRDLTRMAYGAVCFSIFFSFVGTVLGGLWADDSWGRFWGWDPKENGALLIVIWNAIILHARWGKMVGDRGFAVLAVLGNIVVSWSWFGVNLLGIGLHTYGFKEGPAFWLAMFAYSQVAIASLALLPKRAAESGPPAN